MSTEAKKGQPRYLDDICKELISSYIDHDLIDPNQKEEIFNTIDILYGNQGIIGIALVSVANELGKDVSYKKYKKNKKKQAIATIEGNIASISSLLTTIDQQVNTLVGVLSDPLLQEENTEPKFNNDFYELSVIPLGLLGLQMSKPDVITPDADIIFQTEDMSITIEQIIENQMKKHPNKFVLKIHNYNEGTCIVIELGGISNGIKTVKTDLSENPRSKIAQKLDKRTGKSRQALIQHPLGVDENGRIIIMDNRRIKKLKNPEKAIGIDRRKTKVARTTLSMRDFRKALEALHSKAIKTPINELTNKGKFITKSDISKIKEFTKQEFDQLNEYTKISLMKEVIFMSALDPYAALWYLNTTHLDKILLGHHFEDITPVLNIMQAHHMSLENSRNEYHKSNKYNGYNLLVQAINQYSLSRNITIDKPMHRKFTLKPSVPRIDPNTYKFPFSSPRKELAL